MAKHTIKTTEYTESTEQQIRIVHYFPSVSAIDRGGSVVTLFVRGLDG